MKTLLSAVTLTVYLMLAAHSFAAGEPATPAVLLLDPVALAHSHVAARDGDPTIQAQLAALRGRAETALSHAPVSVTDKHIAPASGDPHDYISLSIYWWPDPTTSSGLPYIQRDGVRNTEADDTARYDANPLGRMVGDVETLSLAYFLGGDERYARHAAQLLRTWFLDPDTRMNPNFQFSQIIPGRDAVRGTGIIESRRFTRIVDSVALLGGCACWSPADQQGLRAWFGEFETWLRTSPHGQLEARTTNNHAVWYDVQLVDFALFAGDRQAALQVLGAVPSARIDTQIAIDGSMPRELERTRSFHYSNFNLQAFAELATLGQQVGVDLWSHASPTDGCTNQSPTDGSPNQSSTPAGSLRNALDFLVPYLTGAETWPYAEIAEVDPFHEAAQTLARAAQAYPEGAYAPIVAQLAAGQSPDDQLRLSLGFWPD